MESVTTLIEAPRTLDVPACTKTSHQIVITAEAEDNVLSLVEQPVEVLHQILSYVNIRDFPSLALTCHRLHDLITKDDLLWKAQYLKDFNEPRQIPSVWQQELRRLLLMQQLLQSTDRDAKESQLEEVATTAVSLLTQTKTAHPINNQAWLTALLSSRLNKSAFLSRSSLFRRAGLPYDEPAENEELQQLSAQLHVYYGMEVELSDSEFSDIDGARLVHPCARSRVYDLRRYKAKNFWGPFMDDGSGRVDWEKCQAIMIVLARGLKAFVSRVGKDDESGSGGLFWDRPFYGLMANSFRSVAMGSKGAKRQIDDEMKDEDDFTALDPYGVKGSWMRVVNFLDYHDLFAYNFQPPFVRPEQERPPISTREAIRLILLNLKVTRIEAAGEHLNRDSMEQNDPTMPVVHFEGTSRSITNKWDINGNSRIRGDQDLQWTTVGYVRTTKHGDVRWTTFSVFGGEERWRSESVQIGGIKSARGTIGNWFDKNYDVHGPAGPTAFWKISDDVLETEEEEDDEPEGSEGNLDTEEDDEDEEEVIEVTEEVVDE